MSSQPSMLNKAEDLADNVLRHTKHILPHLGRLCLASTFIEDGIRMWVQWGEQRDYIASTWSCGQFFGALFVFINMVGQIGACAGIFLRKQVPIMCGILFFIIGLQTVAYSILWDLKFLARNLSLVGAVLLLLAESKSEAKSLFAGVPTLDTNKPKAYIQLSGRVLLILMFMTLLHFTLNPLDIFKNLFGLSCMMCITVGFRARLFASFLIAALFIINVTTNNFWSYSSIMNDFLKYDFFQVMSVIGGLLFVIEKGPGDISYDQYKKSM